MHATPDTTTTTSPTTPSEPEQRPKDREPDHSLPSPDSYHDDPELAMIDRRILAGHITP